MSLGENGGREGRVEDGREGEEVEGRSCSKENGGIWRKELGREKRRGGEEDGTESEERN